jgi:hypothetical protein
VKDSIALLTTNPRKRTASFEPSQIATNKQMQISRSSDRIRDQNDIIRKSHFAPLMEGQHIAVRPSESRESEVITPENHCSAVPLLQTMKLTVKLVNIARKLSTWPRN